jgi:hypothetical protein
VDDYPMGWKPVFSTTAWEAFKTRKRTSCPGALWLSGQRGNLGSLVCRPAVVLALALAWVHLPSLSVKTLLLEAMLVTWLPQRRSCRPWSLLPGSQCRKEQAGKEHESPWFACPWRHPTFPVDCWELRILNRAGQIRKWVMEGGWMKIRYMVDGL